MRVYTRVSKNTGVSMHPLTWLAGGWLLGVSGGWVLGLVIGITMLVTLIVKFAAGIGFMLLIVGGIVALVYFVLPRIEQAVTGQPPPRWRRTIDAAAAAEAGRREAERLGA